MILNFRTFVETNFSLKDWKLIITVRKRDFRAKPNLRQAPKIDGSIFASQFSCRLLSAAHFFLNLKISLFSQQLSNNRGVIARESWSLKARAEFTGDPFVKVSNSSNYSPLFAFKNENKKIRGKNCKISTAKSRKRERVLLILVEWERKMTEELLIQVQKWSSKINLELLYLWR